uniref:V-SNARE coiled-coil homology domain-containing protein n=1 Tax=Fibrocapsa japonica TaxID=94617 RepID=A0A7S2V2X1_9STRA|mmetsp:Transcript_4812/g.7218  ORF Transcript_4812/g.7218 Transcript_4812/m.7218 type:complete len:282 (+) Transcript_4812:273-1118(+)|eukprot:CAMPEP_0113943786 /NCGR_PEP_ID=MMETSP1339-20121228/27749_1 /TAXON_ID=94617 /ORGANISM="Fibrocapsa japonica" /LENGTH=281 /DNA_ID=CAMNT_0000948741 /DNA_START=213 /DNA_END=1058 /DNA_ORIENTATION=+ /assembly_acc=CAM_ASM_000762
MEILYTGILQNNTVLASWTAHKSILDATWGPETAGGKAEVSGLCQRLLRRVDRTAVTKMSCVHESIALHYVADAGTFYVCVTKKDAPRRQPFKMLEKLQKVFDQLTQEGRVGFTLDGHWFGGAIMDRELRSLVSKAVAGLATESSVSVGSFQMQGTDCEDPMAAFINSSRSSISSSHTPVPSSNATSVSKGSSVNQKLEEATKTLRAKLETVIDRGEKLELLVDKTSQLEEHAFIFNKNGKLLRRNMQWRRYRIYAIGVAFSTFAAYSIAATQCGLTFSYC